MFTETISPAESPVLSQFEYIIDSEFAYLRTGKLFLAISGGKDSMTLSHLLLKAGMNHVLLHCNFQLRGEESDGDENFIRQYAAENKLQLHVAHFDTYTIAEEKKLSIQECARNLRYDWFRTFLEENNAYLLTAHHLDDSIETFFINLSRGTGFRGLSGIPVAENKIIRPLSDFTSDEIYHYIGANKIDFRRDSGNAKREYLRNKIRHDLIPVLAEIEPSFRDKMRQLFEELTDLRHQVDIDVREFWDIYEKQEGTNTRFELEVVQKLSRFSMEQVFRGQGIYRKNAAAFRKFLDTPTGAVFYSASHQFLIDRDDLVIAKRIRSAVESAIVVHALPLHTYCAGKNISLSLEKEFVLEKNDRAVQQFDAGSVSLPLIVRTWQPGDRLQPLGMKGSKLVSDILIDKKVDRLTKENTLVIVDANQSIICVVGLVIDEKHKVTSGTSEILEVHTTAG